MLLGLSHGSLGHAQSVPTPPLATVKPDKGFIDDAMAITPGGAVLLYVTTDGQKFASLRGLALPAGKGLNPQAAIEPPAAAPPPPAPPAAPVGKGAKGKPPAPVAAPPVPPPPVPFMEEALAKELSAEPQKTKELLKKLKPDCFEDIIAAGALYRPGPLEGGMVDDFISRKHGRTQIVYHHPAMEPILKETYGVIVYQEQVMQISRALAGYSLGGADLLRRAMGKKKKEVMEKEKAKFLDGAQKTGVDQKIADVIEKRLGAEPLEWAFEHTLTRLYPAGNGIQIRAQIGQVQPYALTWRHSTTSSK